MARDGKKGPDDIKAILGHEIGASLAYDATELSKRRARALDYYFGEMSDTPATPNRSSVVSKDVADVIGWMLPGIIRTFTASGRIVDYEPTGPEDEEMSDQASDYVHHEFFHENDGYRILYTATHDSLLMANGIVKQWWDTTPETKVSEHTGLDEMTLAALVMDEGIEVLAQDERADEAGNTVYDVKIERTKSYGCLRYDVVEPEDFLMDKDMVSIDEARFVAQRREVSRSDLIDMGFSPKVIDALPGDASLHLTEEDLERQENRVDTDDSMDRATELIELFECYARIDVDGDGRAEMVRAYYAGKHGAGELLEWEVWEDDVPFDDIPCNPVPHRWDALSVADDVMDMQRVKTVLLRQLLDNLYAVNNPQKEVVLGSVLNTDALVNPKFGQPIFKKEGSVPIIPHEVAFIGDKAMHGLAYIDQIIERRTGVSRQTMALDPEALSNQTATAVQKQQDAAYSKIELIARNQAELGWKKVFRKSLRLITRHQDRAKTIRLRGKWVEMDPRHWNADMDCSVNVGLGTGSRDRDMAMLNNVLQHQVMMAAQLADRGFPQGAVEYVGKIRDVMVKIGEAAGLRNANDFHPEFNDQIKQAMQQIASQPREDPKIALEKTKIQAQMQAEQAKMAVQRDKEMAQMQADMAVEEKRQQTQMMEAERTHALEREKMAMDAAFRERELELKQWEITLRHNAEMSESTGEDGKKVRNVEPFGAGAVKQITETMAMLSQAVAQMQHAQMAPRRVVRDENDNIVGVETVQ